MDRGDRGSGVGPRAESADLQIRMPRQQAEQFTACVTAGPCDRDSSAHVALASCGWLGCILARAPESDRAADLLCKIMQCYEKLCNRSEERRVGKECR